MSVATDLGPAVFETEVALGVALYDLSDSMPKSRRPWKREERKAKAIDTVLIHHSGKLGARGWKGARNMARYRMQQKKPYFPSPPYHFVIPYHDVRDNEGRSVIFRLAPDELVCWHSGSRKPRWKHKPSANQRGLGVVLQGNTTTRPLSHSHEEGLEALLPWLAARHALKGREWLSWHSDAPRRNGRAKKACPGRNAEAWLRGYVRGYVTEAA